MADDKLTHAYVEEMVRFYLGEEPLLRSVPTYDLRRPDVRARALERIDELVVKPRTGHGGPGSSICAHATPGTASAPRGGRDRGAAARVRRPGDRPALHAPDRSATRLEPRHIDLRPFVYWTGTGARSLPGGLSRVAFGRGALVVNSCQAGGAKDTWALWR